MGAEAIGQDRHVERLEVVPELVVGEVVVHVQVHLAAVGELAQPRLEVGGVPRVARAS